MNTRQKNAIHRARREREEARELERAALDAMRVLGLCTSCGAAPGETHGSDCEVPR